MTVTYRKYFQSLLLTLTFYVSFLEFDNLQQVTAQGPPGEGLPHKRFEYKYSFKGPYLAQKDGTVPFWEYIGNAIASEEMVRITPSLRSKKGAIWTKEKTNFDAWEVELFLRVTGRGRIGADGMAFWFTEERLGEGPVFGSQEPWRGLGVFFDSFDNDGKGNNPYIMAMLNDGAKAYDHSNDGASNQLAGCMRDFRNKPFPVRARIEYYRNVLTMSFHQGNTQSDDDYELCFRAENVYLPARGHFGVSAATGGLADDQDVLKFLTWSLRDAAQTPVGVQMAEAEKEKFAKEYEAYKEKLDRQREEYYKLHPEEAKKLDAMSDEELQDLAHRELQQIFATQGQMYETIKHLSHKLDEVIGREERVLSMLTMIQSAGPGAVGQHVPQQGGVPPGGFPIQRHEVDALLQSQRESLQVAREVKSALATGGNPLQGGGGSNQHIMEEILENIRQVKSRQETGSIPQAAASQGCPVPSCLTATPFFIAILVQSTCIIGYLIYKATKDAQNKKFF